VTEKASGWAQREKQEESKRSTILWSPYETMWDKEKDVKKKGHRYRCIWGFNEKANFSAGSDTLPEPQGTVGPSAAQIKKDGEH